MEKAKDMNIMWGTLTDDEKTSRMVTFINKFADDITRHDTISSVKYCKARSMPWLTLSSMEILGYAEQVSNGKWKVNYSFNEVKNFERAEKIIQQNRDTQNEYSRKVAAKKKQAKKFAKDKVVEVEDTGEPFVAPKLIKQIEELIPAIVRKIIFEVEINVKVNLK